MMNEDWSLERTQALIELWKTGLPAGEIGNRLGVTKNAVVGKVHRLGLPKRPSPIKRDPNKPVVRKPPPVEPNVVTLSALKGGMCNWPEGDPGTPEFHFCGEPALAGKPYCAEHCAKAYVRSSPSKERQGTEAA